jgi:NAD(P)H-flavin reductase
MPLPAVITHIQEEAPGVTTYALEFEDTAVQQNYAFQPGQFNMLYAFGIGEVPISVSGDPADTTKIVHTIREVGAVTAALHHLRPGDEVGLRGPFGVGWPVEQAAGGDVLIIAGGIGLAPLRPAMLGVLGERDRYGDVALLYGARTPDDLLFDDDLTRWRGRFDHEVEVTVDGATRRWRGRVGVVTTLIDRVPLDPTRVTAMVCGPEIMMHYCAHTLLDRGVPADRILVSMERNMQCGIGICGHCQFGPFFVCKDGPVFPYAALERLMAIREV